jgi:hypothetical protein
MSEEDLKKIVKDPSKLAEINAFLSSPEGRGMIAETVTEATTELTEENTEIDPVEVERQAAEAKVAAEKAVADQVEAERKAEEDAALVAAGITVYRDAFGNITKLIQEYQADDENGNPIGRSTHLEARNWAELARKQKEAHTQATRAFHRLKDQKTTFKKPTAPIQIPDVPLLSEDERIKAALDLNSEDETVVLKADRKLRADQILRDQRLEAIQKEEHRQEYASAEFKQRHIHDFNPCNANAAFISNYLKENNLTWTVDNLELAFAATEPQLVPVQVSVAEETAPAANPVELKTQPQALVTGINPQPEIVVQEPKPTQVVTPNPQATPRRGVNGGLVPGQSTGLKPAGIPAGLTMKEIMKWTSDQMKMERKNPARRAEIDRVITAYNKARTSRI